MDNEDAELERALAGIAGGNTTADEEDFKDEKPETAEEQPVETPAPVVEEQEKVSFTAPAPTGDLARVKDSVLADLRPIIGSVKLPADEKFDLTMRVYDVTKDGGMLEVAYEATKGINDDGKKADALLRVINEIDKTSK
ncbi:MAG: hypothetical protein LBM12_01705 [Candidatus Nomurabacteria bacterium]|jgi:hypothetical protein|nr:hypothetical protein [Candidatus Nomurabacteria bacterium]